MSRGADIRKRDSMFTACQSGQRGRTAVGSRDYNMQWVERNMDVRGHSGDEYDVLCPSHDDGNASMRVNVEKGVAFCHGCGVGYPMTKLARVVGASYSGDRTELDMVDLLRKLDTLRSQGKEAPSQLFRPESDLDRYAFPTSYWTDPIKRDGTGGRGFTEETVSSFDLGYDPLNDIATIPVRNVHGRLMGFTRRFLDPGADRRYKDPKGFDKGHNLFGSWFAANDPRSTVVLCEGPLDAIKIWQAGWCAMAQYGSNLTGSQIKLVRQMGFVSIILFYDNDAAGYKVSGSALGWTTKEANGKKIVTYDPEHDLRRSFVVKRVQYQNVSATDPGGMSDDDINRLASDAKLVYHRSKTFR